MRSEHLFFIPLRYIVAGLVLLATFNLYMCRINLSIAIVAMSRFNKSSHSSGSDVCDTNTVQQMDSNSTDTTNHYSINQPLVGTLGEFEWDEKTQGMILGTFFYGYIMFQVVGGRLSEMFGAKWLCGAGLIVSMVVNAVTPVIARSGHYWLLLASRVVLGVFQSFVFPSIYALFSKWAPDHERSTCLSIPYVGANIGSVATTALSGYLSEHGFAGGWPSVFYVSAISAAVWLILWIVLVRSEPKDHPWISLDELHYIQTNIAGTGGATKPPVPWVKIFTSIPVLAVIVVKFTVNWNCILLLLKLPSYFSNVFKYPVSKNGLITSLVYAVYTISLFIAGFLADYLIRKDFMNKTLLRKIFQSISTIGSAICLAFIPLAQCNDTLVIALLLIGMFLFGCYSGGDVPVVADMTSNYSATVFGITNTIAFTCGFITPMVIGAILQASDQTRRQWGYVFWLSAGVNVVGGLVFIVFGSAQRQPWDQTHAKPNDNVVTVY